MSAFVEGDKASSILISSVLSIPSKPQNKHLVNELREQPLFRTKYIWYIMLKDTWWSWRWPLVLLRIWKYLDIYAFD